MSKKSKKILRMVVRLLIIIGLLWFMFKVGEYTGKLLDMPYGQYPKFF